jgi:MFS family permease
MLFAVIGHVVMAVFALLLPKTLPLGKAVSWRTLLHASSALVVGQPRLVRFLLVSCCATVAAQFFNMYANLFLNNIGIPHAATRLSYGQVVEIGCMLVLPWLLVRWGPKRVFVIGVAAWALRFVCLAYGGASGWPLALVYVAILLHGACFTFVYITGYIYVDHSATPQTQSAAQGLLAMVTSGLGHLIGSLLSGTMQARLLTPAGVYPPPYDWRSFFLVGAVVALIALGLFWLLMGFNREVMPGEISPDEAV